MDLLLQSFILGIAYGLGPCTLSCAPVMVPIIVSTSKSAKSGFYQAVLFGAGRIVAYMFLGALCGGLGMALNLVVPDWAMSAFLAVLALFLIFRIQEKCLVKHVKMTGKWVSFISGLVMGFSPCAPLVGALALSISSNSIFLGATIAFIFGIGTMLSPILLIGVFSGKWASIKEMKFINNYVSGGFLLILAVLYLLQ